METSVDTNDGRPHYIDRIEGARLWLREFSQDDWQAVHTWASRPEVCRFQVWGPNSPAETRAFLQTVLDEKAVSPRTSFTLAVTLPGQGTPIGSGALFIRSDSFHMGEIAYILHPGYWGQGLGTALARLLLALGFERFGLHRIYATCDPRNLGSGRVLQKVGMTHEGRLRETMQIRDGWRDSDVYGILEHERDRSTPVTI
jgi:[ribosomal protein S5]-alanine N-acetyltransferase